MPHRNIPIFIPHLGCPNQCVFCNQHAISGCHGFDETEVKKQLEAAKKIVSLGMSVRAAETLCKNMAKPTPEKKDEGLKVDYVAECEKQLSKHLGRGVKIVSGKKKGRFELEFYGQEDLQKLLDALMRLK